MRIGSLDSATIKDTTLSLSANRIPLTPIAVLPTTRTSDSLKRIDFPADENNKMSCSPAVISTPTNLSSSLKSIAMMPPFLGREKFLSDVFLQVPVLVTINTY